MLEGAAFLEALLFLSPMAFGLRATRENRVVFPMKESDPIRLEPWGIGREVPIAPAPLVVKFPPDAPLA